MLVTVVETRGSSPQKPGARMLVFPDGSFKGTLGGGCVEGDLWYQARRLFKEGGDARVIRRTLNADLAARDGMVCGGTMTFLLEPFFDDSPLPPELDELEQAILGKTPVALVTVVEDPQSNMPAGTRWLVRGDGTVKGPSNARRLAPEVVTLAKQLAPYGDNRLFTTPAGLQVFVEGITAPATLILLGAGHVNKAIADLAGYLDFRIIVVDDRSDLADRERFPCADAVWVEPYDRALQQMQISHNSFIIAATRGHKFDDQAVKHALATPARYIGILGSQRKVLMIVRHLLQEGLAPDQLKRIYAPVGLDIGALTPEEIAVSVLAEVIMVRRGGSGTSLRIPDDEYLSRFPLSDANP